MSVHSRISSPLNHVGEEPEGFSLDPYVGLSWRQKPILDATGVINQLTTGGSIGTDATGIITYHFYDGRQTIGLYNNPMYGFNALDGLAPFSEAQEEAARNAIELWDDLIPQTFVETDRRNADIMLANSADPAQAYAYTPQARHIGHNYISDMFVADPALNGTNEWFDIGGYGNTTLIHELGHTLGLSHPGNYNFGRDTNNDGVADPITYTLDAQYAQDTDQYTIMSYFAGYEGGSLAIDWNMAIDAYAQAPQVHDILAIQSVYGADTTTRADATTYGFNSNAANALYDFNENPYPYLSIYDAGGIDTIDASGFDDSQFIDLHDGAYSSIGGSAPDAEAFNANWEYYYSLYGLDFPDEWHYTDAEIAGFQAQVEAANAANIALDTGVAGIETTEYSNFGIAYGTVIENAIGGSARDLLWGNEAANELSGLGGDDVLNGFEGNDTLRGGVGNDDLTGGSGDDRFVVAEIGGTDAIRDFASGSDILDLSGIDAIAGGGDDGFTLVGTAAFSGVAGELRAYEEDGINYVAGDVNGDGTADFLINLGTVQVDETDILL